MLQGAKDFGDARFASMGRDKDGFDIFGFGGPQAISKKS